MAMSSCHTTIDPSFVPFRYIPIFRYNFGVVMFAYRDDVFGNTNCPSRYNSWNATPGSLENFTCNRYRCHTPRSNIPTGNNSLSPTCRYNLSSPLFPHWKFNGGDPSAAEWSAFAGCHWIGSHHPFAGTGNDLSNIIENEYHRSSP